MWKTWFVPSASVVERGEGKSWLTVYFYWANFFDKDPHSGCWPLNVGRWSGGLGHRCLKSILQAFLLLCQHFLPKCIHQDGSLHASSPPSASLCLSSNPSLSNERETLVSLRLTGSSARGGKMRRARGLQTKAQEKGWGEGKIKTPESIKHGLLWLNGWRNVLEAWLVSVKALWEGEWRSTIVEPLVHSGGELELRASLLQLWGSHWNH